MSFDVYKLKRFFRQGVYVFSPIMKNATKSLVWVLITFTFGLLQIGVIFLISKIDNDVVFDIFQIMEDGVVVFFSIAIVVSVTLDFVFDIKLNNNMRWGIILLCVISPAVVYILGMFLYISSFMTIIDNKEIYQNLVIFLLSLTFFHAIATKFLLFLSK